MRVVTFKVPTHLLQRLDVYAVRHGMTRSEALRAAIELLLRQPTPRPRIKVKRVVLS